MKRRNVDIIVNSTIIVIVLIVCIWKDWFRPFSTSSEWHRERVVIKNEHNYNQNPDIIRLKNGCYRMYTHGWRSDVEDISSDIYSFYSCDSLNWEFEGMRIKNAAMPAAILLDDGRIRMYFQGSAEREDGKSAPALMTAISDDGLNFKIEERPLLIAGEGELKDIKGFTHFEIIKLNGGYRIFFDEDELQANEMEKYKNTDSFWPVSRIRSIYSEDGLNWKLDPGVRIDFEQEPLIYMQKPSSCTVIKMGDEYHMYFFAGFTPFEDFTPWKRWEWSGVYLATSKDGLNFNIIDKRIATGADPKIIQVGNQLRMYLSRGTIFKPNINYIYTEVKKIRD